MAKLYWRVKRNGKWTWRPAQVLHEYQCYTDMIPKTLVKNLQEEEE